MEPNRTTGSSQTQCPPPPAPLASSRRGLAGWAMALFIVGILLPGLAVVLGLVPGREEAPLVAGAIGIAAAFVLELVAMILGFVAWREAAGKTAAIGGSVCIVVVAVVVVICVFMAVMAAAAPTTPFVYALF